MHQQARSQTRHFENLPLGFTAFYSFDRFLLLSPSYVLDCTDNPYRRLSATLLFGCRGPFYIEVGDGLSLTTRAVLIAPGVPRRRVVAEDSDLAIIDLTMQTPEFELFKPLMADAQMVELELGRVAATLPPLWEGYAGNLACSEVQARIGATIAAICGQAPLQRRLDPRIARAMALIKELPLPQATESALAGLLHLSPSRLRHLFTQEAGVSIAHYARWVAIWRAISLWTHGAPLTDIAHQVGFYDLAHLDHAFYEAFGRSPSSIPRPGNARIIRCG